MAGYSHHKIHKTAIILKENRPLLKDYNVMFGSVVRGKDRPGSDVDIIVEFQPDTHVGLFKLVRLQRQLAKIFGRPVDLATPDALHKALKDKILKESVRAV